MGTSILSHRCRYPRYPSHHPTRRLHDGVSVKWSQTSRRLSGSVQQNTSMKK